MTIYQRWHRFIS